MTKHDDHVVAVIQAFLDHLEGIAERPTLDHLTDEERRDAEALMESLEAGRGIDPHASRPSIERLLAGTPLEALLRRDHRASVGTPDAVTVRDVLAGVDSRARVEIESTEGLTAVVYSYLDLRARFVTIDAYDSGAFITDSVRRTVEAIFDRDPDTTRVGVVAARSDELITQMLAAEDLGRTVTAPSGALHTDWEPAMPLSLAARRMLERCAPEWDPFDFDPALGDAVEALAVAAEIASQLIAQEAGRSYRGEKARAYKSLVGQEGLIVDLVASVTDRTAGSVDLDAETMRIATTAA
jgi:hypothetical protein